MIRLIGIALVIVTTGILTTLVAGAVWRRQTATAVAAMISAGEAAGQDADSVAGAPGRLPPPAARYFDLALPAGRSHVSGAVVHWKGVMRLRPGAAWVPYTAEQHFTTRPPGFVWAAAVRMAPGVRVQVRDEYGRQGGSMVARVAGVVPVVNERGTPEIAQSALTRWLGEAVWMPSALLPDSVEGATVTWQAVDDRTARATVTDGVTSATAEFEFGAEGEITRMRAMRYRDVDGTAVLTPFEGVYRDYVRHAGFWIPTTAEVAWVLPEGRYAYWRGRAESIEYRR